MNKWPSILGDSERGRNLVGLGGKVAESDGNNERKEKRRGNQTWQAMCSSEPWEVA